MSPFAETVPDQFEQPTEFPRPHLVDVSVVPYEVELEEELGKLGAHMRAQMNNRLKARVAESETKLAHKWALREGLACVPEQLRNQQVTVTLSYRQGTYLPRQSSVTMEDGGEQTVENQPVTVKLPVTYAQLYDMLMTDQEMGVRNAVAFKQLNHSEVMPDGTPKSVTWLQSKGDQLFGVNAREYFTNGMESSGKHARENKFSPHEWSGSGAE